MNNLISTKILKTGLGNLDIVAKRQYLVASSILLMLSLICMLFISTAQAGDTLSMKVHAKDKSLVVVLPANPTTGYQWSLVRFDKYLLTMTKSQYQRPQTQLIGAGGQMLFTFILNKGRHYPKHTSILFKYSRPWEKTKGMMKKVNIDFVK